MRAMFRAAAVAAIVLSTVTACEKPLPAVTVFSAGNSVHAEAICWSEDATPVIGSAGCTQDDLVAAVSGDALTTIAITPGKTLGFSVDGELAEAGWYPSIIVDGQAQQLASGPIFKRYWSMTFPESTRGQFPAGGYVLQISALGSTSGSERGVWFFGLVDKTAA